jgi:hypothetical protein
MPSQIQRFTNAAIHASVKAMSGPPGERPDLDTEPQPTSAKLASCSCLPTHCFVPSTVPYPDLRFLRYR